MVKKETVKKEVKKTARKSETVVKKAEKELKPAAKKPAAKAEKKLEPKAKAAAKKTAEDTGSVDFQVKNFSDKIQLLSDHLKKHPHDFDSRRGLLIMVGKRRRLLNYCKKKDVAQYEKLVASLKLKK